MTAIDVLRQEHETIAQLLDALECQINKFERAARPDYDIIRGVADYFLEYPDDCHHPKEDIVFKRLQDRYPQEAAEIADLESEHFELRERARRFYEVVTTLLNDSEMERDTVVNAARIFIESERKHMRQEEENFFPLAERRLTAADWSYIENQMDTHCDLIGNGKVETELKAMGERLLAWQKEYRSG